MSPWSVSVSVVIPVYDGGAWIRDAIESVRRQTCGAGALEVIVVDDGSTDGSAEVASSALQQAELQYRILRASRGGPSRARNQGWRAASGPWIQFLDCDDLLDPGKIAVQLAAASGPGAGTAVLYSPWQRLRLVAGDWRLDEGSLVPELGTDVLADLLGPRGFVHTGSALIGRDWLERVGGFDERLWMIEDVDLLLRLAIAGGGFRYVEADRPLMYYRQHEDSLSGRDPRAFVEGCARNARMVEAHWVQRGELTRQRARALADVYFYAARRLAAAGDPAFEDMAAEIERLVPGYEPPGPPALRRLAGAVGYRRAERIAIVYRALRRRLRAPRPQPATS